MMVRGTRDGEGNGRGADDRAVLDASTVARPWEYRPELDGLRTVAVYLVLLYHCGISALGGGFIGVDLFFVLSGFLVTSVLLVEGSARGTVSVVRFYARRVRRLLPAAVTVIVVTCGVQLLVASTPQRVAMIDDARAALLYYANWQFIADSRDYFATATDRSPFLHFWSLSIEEQFYVALPLLVWLLWRRSRTPEKALAIAAAGVLVVSAGLQLVRASSDATYAYYATDTRVYQMAAGVLLACLLRRGSARAPSAGTARGPAAPLALTGLGLLLVLATSFDDLAASWRGLAAAAASVLVLAGLTVGAGGPVGRVLSWEPIRYLGTISYAIYLWHWPLVLAVDSVLDLRPVVLGLVVGLLSAALAALSERLLESPVRRSRRLAPHPRLVAIGGLAVSVVAALLVVQPVLSVDRRPAVAASTESPGLREVQAAARVLQRPVPRGLDLVGALADVPRSGGICTVDDLHACRRVEGAEGGLRVVLVGDSQAAMFVEAFVRLAQDRGWTLHTSVAKACSWQQGLQNEVSPPADQARCRSARADFYADVLPRLQADVVVAISLSRSAQRWEEDLTAGDAPAGETLVERQLRTSRATVEAVTDAGASLVLVKSVMGTQGYDVTGPDPLDCLARARVLGDCAVVQPLGKPPVDGIYETLAVETDAVATVDLNPAICLTPPLCQPVRRRTVIWKDPDHITGTFAVEQRERFLGRLRRAAPDLEW